MIYVAEQWWRDVAEQRWRTSSVTDTIAAPWRVPLSDVVVDDELIAATADAVQSGWWSTGPRVEQLEQDFAAECETRHAIAVSSGTAALHLALLAVECGPGDEVILPSLNFVAAANVICHVGATPVLCDVRARDDLNLDPDDVEAAIGPATKAILVLHYGGFPCDMDAILPLAEAHGLVVIEDAAHAPGARLHGRPCGSLGTVGCFSFFANKNLPVGEGGMIVTDDPEIQRRVRLLRSHGMTTLTWDRHRGHASTYDVVEHGFNYRMDEIRAAAGLVQLGRLSERNEDRARIAGRYRDALSGVPGMTVPFERIGDSEPAHHLMTVVLPREISREEVREALATRRIQTSVHYPPIHRFSAFARTTRVLPRTDDVADSLITLPLFPHLTDEALEYVIASFLEMVEG
jgi:dTDP-4-amino-4,6-dideoxygalactose transaminase